MDISQSEVIASLHAALGTVTEVVAANKPASAILQTIAEQVCARLGASACGLYQQDPTSGNLWITAACNLHPDYVAAAQVPLGGALVGAAVQERCTRIQENIAPETIQLGEMIPEEIQRAIRTGMLPFATIVATPLVVGDAVYGGLVAYFGVENAPTPATVPLLELFATQVALIIQNSILRERTQALQALQELLPSLNTSSSLRAVLTRGLTEMADLAGAQGAVLLTPIPDGTALTIAAISEGLATEPGRQWPLDALCPCVQAFVRGSVMVTDRQAMTAERDARPPFPSPLGDGWATMVSLPVVGNSGRLGALDLAFATPRRVSPEDLSLYQTFANVLGLLLETGQLVRQRQRLAAAEERARLARELHDSVTQSLFSMTLTAKAASRIIARDVTMAGEMLGELQDLAYAALSEMRALIYELRPTALEEEGLVAALRKRAAATQARTGLTVTLQTDGESRLSPEQEEALYYIAREALHNAVKHAEAQEALVVLTFRPDLTELKIRDDGLGFDDARQIPVGMGLQTMRERAAQIGASFEVTSALGRGTSIQVRLPRNGVSA